MRELWIVVVLALALPGCSLSVQAESGAAAEPTVFCQVIKEPDPELLGWRKCTFSLDVGKGERDINPAEYRLIKIGDKYALFFDRVARNGRKRYTGWKDWTIDGKEIRSTTGVRIFTENGQVFFQWKDESPVEMTKIGS